MNKKLKHKIIKNYKKKLKNINKNKKNPSKTYKHDQENITRSYTTEENLCEGTPKWASTPKISKVGKREKMNHKYLNVCEDNRINRLNNVELIDTSKEDTQSGYENKERTAMSLHELNEYTKQRYYPNKTEDDPNDSDEYIEIARYINNNNTSILEETIYGPQTPTKNENHAITRHSPPERSWDGYVSRSTITNTQYLYITIEIKRGDVNESTQNNTHIQHTTINACTPYTSSFNNSQNNVSIGSMQNLSYIEASGNNKFNSLNDESENLSNAILKETFEAATNDVFVGASNYNKKKNNYHRKIPENNGINAKQINRVSSGKTSKSKKKKIFI